MRNSLFIILFIALVLPFQKEKLPDIDRYMKTGLAFSRPENAREKDIGKNGKEDAVYVAEITEEKKEGEFGISMSKIYTLVSVSAVLFIFLMLVLLRKRKKGMNLIREKDSIISQKEEEKQILQQKINESFEEVIRLAKSNEPEFFTRFQEVYPEVTAELLKINPGFRVSELTLCAYIFLGFTTKDIATYTFTSVNTVKVRKYKLRKKLNIPAEMSTEMWFRNLGYE